MLTELALVRACARGGPVSANREYFYRMILEIRTLKSKPKSAARIEISTPFGPFSIYTRLFLFSSLGPLLAFAQTRATCAIRASRCCLENLDFSARTAVLGGNFYLIYQLDLPATRPMR